MLAQRQRLTRALGVAAGRSLARPKGTAERVVSASALLAAGRGRGALRSTEGFALATGARMPALGMGGGDIQFVVDEEDLPKRRSGRWHGSRMRGPDANGGGVIR